MKKHLLLIFLLITGGLYAFAQGPGSKKEILKNDSLLKLELAKETYTAYPDAKAIILYKACKVHCDLTGLEYRVEVVAKILSDDAAQDLGLMDIPFRVTHKLTELYGCTYNLDGAIIKQSVLEKDGRIKEKFNNSINIIKLNFPAVKKGSIIHYYYKAIYGFGTVPTWYIEDKYPVLFSMYDVTIPGYIRFKKEEALKASKKTVTNYSDLGKYNSEYLQEVQEVSRTACNRLVWTRSNIPAFVEEPFADNEKTNKEQVKIHLTAINYEHYSAYIYDNWEQVNKDYFYDNKDFTGQVFSFNDFLNDKVKTLTKDCKTDLDKAKTIYTFIRDNYDVNTNSDKTDIKATFKNNTGGIIEINLLLIAMLKKAGLNCDPILLSTRDNEKLSPVFPSVNNINYIVACVNINDKNILLDASSHYLAFGVLNPLCYNYYSRKVNEKGDHFNLDPNDITDKIVCNVQVSPSEQSNKFNIKLDKKFGNYSSFKERTNLKNDSSETKELLTKRFSESKDFDVQDVDFINLSKVDEPLKLNYRGTYDLSKDDSIIYLDLFFEKFFESNPFTASSRINFINFETKTDRIYTVNFKIPEGYNLDDFPKSTTKKLDDYGSIIFSNYTEYDKENRIFILNSRLTFDRVSYFPSEYEALRWLFKNIIEEQKKKIVLKKVG